MMSNLPQWKVGDVLSASKLNAMVDAINDLLAGQTGNTDVYITLDELNDILKRYSEIGHTHSVDEIVDLVLPTKVSDLTNDAGYLTEHQDISNKADKSEIPTRTSQLQNDSDYATNASVDEKIANVSTGGQVDLTSYAKKTDLPTKTSQLTNDSDFATNASVDEKIANVNAGGTIVTNQVEPAELDVPRLYFYGNALPTTKDNVNLEMDYKSNTMKFHSYVKLKCQGTSSMSYAKKNFTVTLYEDADRSTKLKKNFKGWGAQNKFCLKANWVDSTHTRNISGARIAYDMVASRPDSPFKQELLKCPRNGAVDGFPIKVYFNGEFWGIYTFNIPKDAWMFNMNEDNPNHIVLCAERNTDGNSSAINSCQFRKLWDGVDGGDWSYEVGTPSDTVKNSLNRCISFVMNASDQEFHDNISQYFDLYSLLDYYCFSYVTCHIDGLAKNMLLVTYDGTIWGACLYDMDSIYGVHWNGASFVSPEYKCPEQYQEQFSRLWVRIEECFANELKARYAELRQEALSLTNIIGHVEEIYDLLSPNMKTDETTKWTNIPQYNVNTMTRFRNYMRDRVKYVDAEMKAMANNIHCTNIALSADTLSFITADTQTLSVTVSPTNCTDTINWSVSPSGIVTVVNGVVTPVSNGSCTITVTCGSYSDTCSVTVSLPNIECTGISLNKNTLTLGGVGSDTDNLGINLLDGVEWADGDLDIFTGAIKSSSTDKYTELNVSTPGKYTLSSTVGYTYKKITLCKTDGTFIYGIGNQNTTSNYSVNITEPCIVRISAYPNNLVWDSSAISFIGVNFSEVITDKDVTYTLTASDINVRYVGSEYVFTELFFDRIYNDIVIVKYDGNTYKSLFNPTMAADDMGINKIKNINNLGYNYYGNWDGKSFLFTALPIAYGTTADEILANMTSTTIAINPTDELSKLTTSTTLSAQLTATVTPENCTQSVVWSVSPEGICTVNNGLVKAKANGECTITATCGQHSATCNVNVSEIEDQPVREGYTTVVFNGSENWTVPNWDRYTDTSYGVYELNINGYINSTVEFPTTGEDIPTFICDTFDPKTQLVMHNTPQEGICGTVYLGKKLIAVASASFPINDVAAFKSYLNQNNLVVYFKNK